MKAKLNFDVSASDADLIHAIVIRAASLLDDFKRLELTMDLTAVHANGCPLRLEDLLHADKLNFVHDIIGIQKHLHRANGKLYNFFTPRFAKLQSASETQPRSRSKPPESK